MQRWTTSEANGLVHPPDPNTLVRMGEVTIDLDGQAVIRDGREIRLSPTEYGLLSILATSAGRVIDQRTLLRSVWGLGYGNKRNYLRTYIYNLRAKLETNPHLPEVIVTVGVRGYRLGAPAVLVDTHGR